MRDTVGEERTNLEIRFFKEPLHIDVPVLVDQQELIYIGSAQTHKVIWKTCRERWMIVTNWGRESRKSVLSGRLDDDELLISLSAMDKIELLLFFYKDGFGIK